MKKINWLISGVLLILCCCGGAAVSYADCLIGAFLSDTPARSDIVNFKENYGKKPYLVMVFVDWENYVSRDIIRDVYSENCALFVTWEPWKAKSKEGIDYDGLVSGKYDKYVTDFAYCLRDIKKEVFVRFAHEVNGNWYPWSGTKIGKDKYIAIYRHVKDVFNKTGVTNVKWVFSVNWEDVPVENNNYLSYYPGTEYVDYIGIDGYNWGNTKSWSRWMWFKEIFENRYNEIKSSFKKPIIISEFSSTSAGGNKDMWIKDAMRDTKKMNGIKAFVIFNVDKETDWGFPIDIDYGKKLKEQLRDDYFRDSK